MTYQKSAGDLNYQASAFFRNSSVHFLPDPVGDLYFNGVASNEKRTLYSGGLQADASYNFGDKHTIRGGVMLLDESVRRDRPRPCSTGHPPAIQPVRRIPSQTITFHGLFAGVYLQDEWKIMPQLTFNYGARFDEFYSSFDQENQLSPRVNLIYQPTDSTTLHAGYARYFTPPPVENVSASTVALFNGTSNASASPNRMTR